MATCCKKVQPKKVQPKKVAAQKVEPKRGKVTDQARSQRLAAQARRKATEAAMKAVAAQRNAQKRCSGC